MRRIPLAPAAALALLLAAVGPVRAQFGTGLLPPRAETLVHVSAATVRIEAGGRAIAAIELALEPGWHVNSNPPSPDYMIPTEVEIEPAAGLRAGKPVYPAPEPLKVGFEESPIHTYGGRFTVSVPLAAARTAAGGAHTLKGRVRYQACNDQVCLTPASVPFALAVEVAGGTPGGAPDPAAGGAPSDTSGTPDHPAGTGFTTAPPPDGARAAPPGNPITRSLAQGGVGAFLAIFLVGLALNLTPCVYPMMGVTLAIFGARREGPRRQVFALALIYVLGMALMYSTLGVVAALTGGLFGAFLQHPAVLVGIGLLLVALALSMFGLYSLQPPPALLEKLGGATATSAAGVFLSGLVVGVFAAPCIGPPVVALLAVVGAKGDPWFGFSTFFTLSMGLGAPYLVLGTYSSLLRRLPRSGEWMVWVERLFGVVLLGVGLFYAALALAPKQAGWVLPATLVAGGLYLGFFERSAHARRGFRWLKRVAGTAAVVGGVLIVATTPAPGIEFRHGSRADLDASLRAGRAAMLDFSADWCVPCHELERFTFTHPDVIEIAKGFETFKVDLTRYDSPEAEAWRREFEITGVPTVVFLTPDGREVREARVEGFMPPPPFLERMRIAVRAGQRAGGDWRPGRF